MIQIPKLQRSKEEIEQEEKLIRKRQIVLTIKNPDAKPDEYEEEFPAMQLGPNNMVYVPKPQKIINQITIESPRRNQPYQQDNQYISTFNAQKFGYIASAENQESPVKNYDVHKLNLSKKVEQQKEQFEKEKQFQQEQLKQKLNNTKQKEFGSINTKDRVVSQRTIDKHPNEIPILVIHTEEPETLQEFVQASTISTSIHHHNRAQKMVKKYDIGDQIQIRNNQQIYEILENQTQSSFHYLHESNRESVVISFKQNPIYELEQLKQGNSNSKMIFEVPNEKLTQFIQENNQQVLNNEQISGINLVESRTQDSFQQKNIFYSKLNDTSIKNQLTQNNTVIDSNTNIMLTPMINDSRQQILKQEQLLQSKIKANQQDNDSLEVDLIKRNTILQNQVEHLSSNKLNKSNQLIDSQSKLIKIQPINNESHELKSSKKIIKEEIMQNKNQDEINNKSINQSHEQQNDKLQNKSQSIEVNNFYQLNNDYQKKSINQQLKDDINHHDEQVQKIDLQNKNHLINNEDQQTYNEIQNNHNQVITNSIQNNLNSQHHNQQKNDFQENLIDSKQKNHEQIYKNVQQINHNVEQINNNDQQKNVEQINNYVEQINNNNNISKEQENDNNERIQKIQNKNNEKPNQNSLSKSQKFTNTLDIQHVQNQYENQIQKLILYEDNPKQQFNQVQNKSLRLEQNSFKLEDVKLQGFNLVESRNHEVKYDIRNKNFNPLSQQFSQNVILQSEPVFDRNKIEIQQKNQFVKAYDVKSQIVLVQPNFKQIKPIYQDNVKFISKNFKQNLFEQPQQPRSKSSNTRKIFDSPPKINQLLSTKQRQSGLGINISGKLSQKDNGIFKNVEKNYIDNKYKQKIF